MNPPAEFSGVFPVIDALVSGNWAVLRRPSAFDFTGTDLGLLFHCRAAAHHACSAMLEVLSQDYVRTARAKGLQERLVVFRHIFKNALPSVLTTIGLTFGSLLSGAVLTETIFGWPGLGRYATTSINTLDLPAVMGVTLVAAFIYPIVNTVVDIGDGFVDPRVRVD